jgi:hypothetical protein
MTHGHRHPKSQGTNFMEKTTGLAYKIKEKNKELRRTRKKKKKDLWAFFENSSKGIFVIPQATD